jgi:hypothetical protein
VVEGRWLADQRAEKLGDLLAVARDLSRTAVVTRSRIGYQGVVIVEPTIIVSGPNGRAAWEGKR